MLNYKDSISICFIREINLNFFFQVELERLNKASDEINKLELELDVSYSFL